MKCPEFVLQNIPLLSFNKSVKIEILQPEVKELLSTCAQYNLEHLKQRNNGEVDSRSAQVLEEIRQAEAENIQRGINVIFISLDNFQIKILFQSKLKSRQAIKDDNNSLYDNNDDKDLTANKKKNHSTLVMMDHNGSPVTTLLNRHPSRDGSPFKTLEKAPSTSTPAPPMSDSTPDNIPVMPVLFSIFAYICLGGLRDFYDSNCDLS